MLVVLSVIKVNQVETWNFSDFIAIFSNINQPCPKWANFYDNQANEINLPKMGKCFTTILGQSDWLRHCYWLSCLTYGQSSRHRGDLVG